MKVLRFCGMLLIIVFGSRQTATASSTCESMATDPARLREALSGIVARQTPAKYHDLLGNIQVITTAPEQALIPFATEQRGKKLVILPPAFAKVACEMVYAEYLVLNGSKRDILARSADVAANCLNKGRPLNSCLTSFGEDLGKGYSTTWARMSNDHRKTAFAIYKAALNQIVMHEFAHHFLDHLARIKGGKLARIDAEFEADLFAILNGVQAGEPASAMFYFFDAMAEIEQRTQILKTNDYESGSCRSSNVDNITEFFGITPILVLDGAFGGGAYASRTSPQMFFSLGKEQFAHTPTLKSGYCGRIASVALPAAFEELRHLYLRVGEDVKFLYSDQQNPDSDRANRLLRDLAEMSTTFHYMDGIAMKCMALMLQKWGLKGHRLTPLLGQVDKLVNTPELAGKFQSEDLGRLFLAEGIAVFQEQKQLPRQARLDRSYSLLQRAVLYNPDLAEAWQNLGFIAFMRANCRSASNFGDRSIATMSAEQDSKTLEGVRFFAQYMKLLSSDQNRCAAEGSKFEPY